MLISFLKLLFLKLLFFKKLKKTYIFKLKAIKSNNTYAKI